MARFELPGITVEVAERDLELLSALASEAPWRFGNGVVPASIQARFGLPHAALERLRQSGLVTCEFYHTGAVSEFDLSVSGRAFMEALANRGQPGAAAGPKFN